MATIDELVERIRQTPDCSLDPPAGLPTVMPGTDDLIPDDLARFYTLCGGGRLFREADYGFVIAVPAAVVPVDLEHLGKVYTSDISAHWYAIAWAPDSTLDTVSIDLAPKRLGRCYESFFESHRQKGMCPIVATSFSDLLQRVLDEGGSYYHWKEPGFQTLGDAYDGYEPRWQEEEYGS